MEMLYVAVGGLNRSSTQVRADGSRYVVILTEFAGQTGGKYLFLFKFLEFIDGVLVFGIKF